MPFPVKISLDDIPAELYMRLEFLVGRSELADVVLADPEASRKHFRLISDPNWRIQDVSANGTLVDGDLVLSSVVPVREGTVVQCGRHCLRLLALPRLEAGLRTQRSLDLPCLLIEPHPKGYAVCLGDVPCFPINRADAETLTVLLWKGETPDGWSEVSARQAVHLLRGKKPKLTAEERVESFDRNFWEQRRRRLQVWWSDVRRVAQPLVGRLPEQIIRPGDHPSTWMLNLRVGRYRSEVPLPLVE